ncbi:unnamed protein product [Microthlaspi erraticum]|uniref:Uncharacterized protein n=1 Tax=Microthlaspi erraticum TaxID=1685480 RepID=A0A6D2KWX3_9BRAS|nr:unnamed protein product [Microthlaspi erraticum]
MCGSTTQLHGRDAAPRVRETIEEPYIRRATSTFYATTKPKNSEEATRDRWLLEARAKAPRSNLETCDRMVKATASGNDHIPDDDVDTFLRVWQRPYPSQMDQTL